MDGTRDDSGELKERAGNDTFLPDLLTPTRLLGAADGCDHWLSARAVSRPDSRISWRKTYFAPSSRSDRHSPVLLGAVQCFSGGTLGGGDDCGRDVADGISLVGRCGELGHRRRTAHRRVAAVR